MPELTTDLFTFAQSAETLKNILGNPQVTLLAQILHEEKGVVEEESKNKLNVFDRREWTLLPAEQKIIFLHNRLLEKFERRIPYANEAAQIVGLSLWEFRSLFASLYGDSYYNYFLSRRMGQAKRYLEEGRYTVKELTTLLGYSQPTKFIIVFKKHLGITPGRLKIKRGRQSKTSV